MTTPVGRGRGYANRNKDILRKSELSTLQSSPPTSSNIAAPQIVSNSAAKSHSPNRQPSKNNHQNKPPIKIDSTANHVKSLNLNRTHPKMLSVNKPAPDQKINVESGNYYDPGQFEDNENFADENAQSVLFIEEKYFYLVEQVRVLSDTDDGILTNQKLKHLEEVITRVCGHPQQLRGAMESLASAAILDINMATKVSKMMSSVSFFFLQIHQQRLYHIFVAAIHDKVDGLEISLDGADKYFINSSTVLTEMFKESKIRDTDNTTNLAHLIIQVFIGLLECNTPMALRTLNVQLMQYGKNLYTCVPEKLDNMSLSVRKLIISRQPPRSSCRIWLSLLADQCLVRFQPLPKYLQDYYARHLDESNCDLEPRDSCFASELPTSDDSCISRLPQTLNNHRVQEYCNTREKRNSDSSDKWSVISNGDRGYCKSMTSDHHADDSLDDEAFKHELTFDSLSVSERKPRPILGAGSKRPSKSDHDNQYSDMYNNSVENTNDIPKFCPSVPPPNFIPKHASQDFINAKSVSQDNYDFWNHPPPALPPSNLNNKRFDNAPQPTSSLSKRLDLNSWRQSANKDPVYSDSAEESNKISERNTFNSDEKNNIFKPDRRTSTENQFRVDDSNFKTQTVPEEMKNDKYKNYEPRQSESTAYWENKKNDAEYVMSKIASRLQFAEKKKYDEQRETNIEDNDLNWRDDNKNVDIKSDTGSEKKELVRRDSRGSARQTKRDVMEVSRKASYWTHDDRCDKDYDG